MHGFLTMGKLIRASQSMIDMMAVALKRPGRLGRVIAPLVGVIGALQASEALQLLAGRPAALAGRLLRYDALGARLRSARLPRDPDCPVCGRRAG